MYVDDIYIYYVYIYIYIHTYSGEEEYRKIPLSELTKKNCKVPAERPQTDMDIPGGAPVR